MPKQSTKTRFTGKALSTHQKPATHKTRSIHKEAPADKTLAAHQLSFQLETGEWLFKDLSFSLNDRFTGLVGRNGVGKSVLFSLLAGLLVPTQGVVNRPGHHPRATPNLDEMTNRVNLTRTGVATLESKLGYYSQLPSSLLTQTITVAEFLGIEEKRRALLAISEGRYEQAHFDLVDEDWHLEERVKAQLETLRITPDLDALCHTLSGGQLACLQLHQLFESNSAILLLDEPSNHLDDLGREWLIEQCLQFEGQVFVITHDRSLLRHVDAIYRLTSLGIDYFKGSYDDYFAQSTAQSAALNKQISHLSSEQKKLERQAQVNQEKAQQREAKGNRLRRSGSQPKILMDAMKDKAGRTKGAAAITQRNQQARNAEKLQALKAKKEQLKPQAMYLSPSDNGKKRTLLSIEQCLLKYGCGNLVSFSMTQGERVRLQGQNGCGKSTLLKSIANGAAPESGDIRCYDNTVYLDQHFGLLDNETSLLENLLTRSDGLTVSTARVLLAGMGFRRDTVHRKTKHLSGGEKMKLSMLIVSHIPKTPLLLLDEPDNHLDIESKQLLANALRYYKGAFILVSHDRDFVDEVGISRIITMN
ncbi:ATP-binding cassette domain-containing protein [Vibrio sp. 10N.261.51.F12]|uniref:ATP-binding cassette domain-containing protein n=1 Tax=Vibrio sp. 10N.261.51.F12 TaxID=3229679 RepID=UPI00354D2DF5